MTITDLEIRLDLDLNLDKPVVCDAPDCSDQAMYVVKHGTTCGVLVCQEHKESTDKVVKWALTWRTKIKCNICGDDPIDPQIVRLIPI